MSLISLTPASPETAELMRRGVRVWFDEHAITIGDNLRRTIDRGLIHSRFGVVIISPSFLAKEWPNRELDALIPRLRLSEDEPLCPRS